VVKLADVLADRFELERHAGAGGMGQVFRALDRLTGEAVALKVLTDQTQDDRFLREAKVLAELSHPGIVRHVAHGTTRDGEPFLVMEWLEGETLSARLRRGRLTDEESLVVVSRMADALSVVHRKGIVHRDVKPGNVVLVESRPERAKLLDFGIAHVSDASTVMTRTGAVLGTFAYMAPEQAQGVRDIDARADVFALGAVLFHCLTGRAPFAGGGAVAVLAKLVLDEAPRLSSLRPDLPAELDDLMAHLLCKEPAGRPPHAGAVHEGLSRIRLAAEPASAPAADASEVLTSSEQRLVAVLLASGIGEEEHSEWGSTAFESVGSATGSVVSEAPTRTDGPSAGRIVRDARRVISEFGGRLEPLRSGSLAILLTGGRDVRGSAATDLGARAARCALAVRRLLPNVPMALAIGRGIVAGALPVGEAIDRAAAALPDAPKGKGIALCAVTAGLLGPGFEVSGGSQRAVLLRERRVEVSRNLLGRPTRTVGRDRELGFLESLLDECISEPIARAALAIGPAGIGKSRIRYELGRRLAERDDEVTVWTARGDPMSAGSPFGLVAQTLRRCIDVHDGEPPVDSRKRLAKFVARRFPRSERARLESFLGELSRIPLVEEPDEQLAAARRDPVLMGDQTRRAFEDLVLAVCREGPLLLVFEDLHWGDLPSVSLIDSVLRVAKDQPFMVLALARPEVRDVFPSLWSQREVAELKIGALRRKAAEQLVREVLGDDTSDELVQRIVARADGNAFYLEELIRSVSEGEERLPETVLAMVQSRLESLPEPARRVLRAASVFGGVFWDGGVAALLGSEQEPDEVQEWLASLAERELVTPRPTSRFPAVAEYVFRHALVREAAFGMLTPEDAKRGHRLTGRWLEENGEPDAFVLAQHFDRGADHESALSWFRTAAEEALAGNDFAASARASERALELATELEAAPSLIGALTLLRADASYWQGQHPEAMGRAERAMALLEPGDDPWMKAASLVAGSAHRSGEPEAARKIGERLLSEGYCDRPSSIVLFAICRIATVLVQVGDYEQADALFAHVDVWAPGIDEPASQARWNASLAARALFRGHTWGYRVLSERAAAACEASGDIRTHLIHRHNAGHSCLVLGQLELAESRLRDVLDRGERVGVRNLVASAKNNLGAALGALGRFDEARKLLDEAITELTAQTDRRMEGGARNHLAELLLASGDPVGAVAEAERAVELLARVTPTRLHAEGTLALALLEAGDAQRALEVARRSNAELDAVGSIADGEGSVRLSLALALRANGDPDAAVRVARASLDRLRQQAEGIEDAEGRKAFLERVAAHRRLAEIAAAAG